MVTLLFKTDEVILAIIRRAAIKNFFLEGNPKTKQPNINEVNGIKQKARHIPGCRLISDDINE